MEDHERIVGIDLGTTNSEIAAFIDGRVRVIAYGTETMLPSCVGLSTAGALLVGSAARNQLLLYPERTVRSIKRKMGSDETVTLGDRTYTPQEISALLLRELAEWAREKLGAPVHKAVISVPAYFSDAQRQATREAGEIAGLEVVRILNEPTAASLAYGYGSEQRRTVMIYDLGGGTFDVSIVTIEQDITEVLTSHGNNQLGGDDFDRLLVERLIDAFKETHGVDLSDGHPAACARLWWAAEAAKKTLSAEPFVNIRQEALVNVEGKPLHLDVEISREEFEALLNPQIESTLACVTKAMDDAGKKPGELDAVLLVGGSTRIPMVSAVLEERTGIVPRHDIHPDMCVCLGAGVLASRLSGRDVARVLVDVTPYAFGPAYLGERGGVPYPYCYHPVIQANTPLPVTRTEKYYTSFPFQREVQIDIYQGDDPDALKNIPVGNFHIKGLKPTEAPNMVLCKMSLDIDGILKVTAIEKATGKSKQITIDKALRKKSDEEIAEARKQIQDLYDSRAAGMIGPLDALDGPGADKSLETFSEAALPVQEEIDPRAAAADGTAETAAGAPETDSEWNQAARDAEKLLARSRRIMDEMHSEDKEEAIDLHEQIESAMASKNQALLGEACETLGELLFFVEGK